MIEKFEFNDGPDLASMAGRGTLLAGTAYGLYKTAPDIASIANAGAFTRGLKGLMPSPKASSAMNAAVNPVESTLSMGSLMKRYSSISNARNAPRPKSINDLSMILSAGAGGFKGRSEALPYEIRQLYSDIAAKYGEESVSITATHAKGIRGRARSVVPDMVTIKAGDKFSLDIPIVDNEGRILQGKNSQNMYIARSVLKDFDPSTGSVKIEGLDVALTRKYRELLPDIMSGKISPRDIRRAATDKAIWEGTRGNIDFSKMSAPVLSEIRREQVVVDPFGQMTGNRMTTLMENITSIKGYGGGSASMFAKGVFSTPESLLSSGLPGAETSISAYQIARQTSFKGAKKPSIKWAGDLDLGVGKFNVATVEPGTKAYNRLMELSGVGELADEEAILNKSRDVKLRNQLYNFKITPESKTKLTDKIFRDIYDKAPQFGLDPMTVSKAMTEPGTLNRPIQEKVNALLESIDMNAPYQRLRDRKSALNRETRSLLKQRSNLRSEALALSGIGLGENNQRARVLNKQISKIEAQIKSKINASRSVKSAIRDFGVLGYDEFGAAVKLPKDNVKNFISSVSVNPEKSISFGAITESPFAEGAKPFTGSGGGKWTIKAQGDVPRMLATVEAEALWEIEGTPLTKQAREKDIQRLIENFRHIDMVSVESPIKIKDGVLSPRDVPAAVISYAESVMDSGDPSRIARLKDLGIVDGEFKPTGMSARDFVNKIEEIEGKPIGDVFSKDQYLSSISERSVLMSADITSAQSGMGKAATITERGIYNLQGMGLDEFSQDILSRKMNQFNPVSQMADITKARSIMADATSSGVSAKSVLVNSSSYFSDDLSVRRKAFDGKNMLTVNLGEDISGISKISLFASDEMTPYIGRTGGGAMSQLDEAAMGLLRATQTGSEETKKLMAKKYRAALDQVEENAAKSIFKGKVKGGMYGQAASSLPGMDDAAIALGKKMGLKSGLAAPIVAMSEADVARRFNIYDEAGNLTFNAVKEARSGNLFGMISREPIEGVHSTMPTQIRLAEDFGGSVTKMRGSIFVSGIEQSKSMIRRALFLDFDKDTVNVIAATTKKSTDQIKKFMGLSGEQSLEGRLFNESIERMTAFDIKSKKPLSFSDLTDIELPLLVSRQKGQEKGMIGKFSNEFKNIHVGLREQLGPMSTAASKEAFFLGEDFSHLFIENILKAKHQSKEAMLANSVQDVIDLFKEDVGSRFFKMDKGQKAEELRNVFDELTFGSKQIAEEVRAETSKMASAELAEKMGLADDLELATRRRDAYRRITATSNMQNIIEAHGVGKQAQLEADQLVRAARGKVSMGASVTNYLDDISRASRNLMSKGLKNVGLYGILPTAGIGLMASLASGPKDITPQTKTAIDHESGQQRVEMGGKTLFNLPEPQVSSYDIKGRINKATDMAALSSLGAGRNTNIRTSDQRMPLDKYKIEEMMSKGY